MQYVFYNLLVLGCSKHRYSVISNLPDRKLRPTAARARCGHGERLRRYPAAAEAIGISDSQNQFQTTRGSRHVHPGVLSHLENMSAQLIQSYGI